MTDFWRSYFTAWCLFIIIFGLALAGGALPATDGIATLIFGIIGARELEWTPVLRFSVALMGCVTLGWGLTLLASVRAAIASGDAAGQLWRGILVAVLVWYLLDSALSAATGFWMNAIPNTLIMAAFVIGLVGSSALSQRAA